MQGCLSTPSEAPIVLRASREPGAAGAERDMEDAERGGPHGRPNAKCAGRGSARASTDAGPRVSDRSAGGTRT